MPHKDPEARRAYQREYQKRWRATHPEKVAEIRQRFDETHPDYYKEYRADPANKAKAHASYEAHAEERRAKALERYYANRDAIIARVTAWRAAHPERVSINAAASYQRHREERRAKQDEWAEANRESIAKRRADYNLMLRIDVLGHYSQGTFACACCGADQLEFLTLEHVNGDGAEHRRRLGRNQHIYRELRSNGFPGGYAVLCMNCNFARGMYGYCPHELS